MKETHRKKLDTKYEKKRVREDLIKIFGESAYVFFANDYYEDFFSFDLSNSYYYDFSEFELLNKLNWDYYINAFSGSLYEELIDFLYKVSENMKSLDEEQTFLYIEVLRERESYEDLKKDSEIIKSDGYSILIRQDIEYKYVSIFLFSKQWYLV